MTTTDVGAGAPTLAFDVGGTFTDIVVVEADGSVTAEKVLSVQAVVEAAVGGQLEAALARSGHDRLAALLHATTRPSNALLERSGPRIGLLTTKGFRDELEFRRGSRPSIYDFDWQRTPPLIPRRFRLEVPERVTASGAVREPLDVAATRDALSTLRSAGVEALAICFLNAHANPTHEQLAAELAREILPDVAVCTSHTVLPQPREYERASTTSVNAYLMPVVDAYLDWLDRRFAAESRTVRMMRSNGGLMSLEDARRAPVHLVESGPAAGVLAAAALCREVGLDRAVSVDMGGTTVKACLIEDGMPEERTEYEVGGERHMSARYSQGSGYAIAVPSFDVVEAGAGGGSIARVEDGVLRVGPTSAGADPGPAAYGNGGTLPTVTDANIVLGFINPDLIAGGTLRISRQAAIDAIEEHLGSRLQLDVRDIAHGIREVANAAMLRSIRAVTSEKGRDPRQYVMIAFGGSGPVHAASLAQMAGIRKVYVPPLPGLFSSVGLVLADMRYDYVRAVSGRLEPGPIDEEIVAAFGALVDEARAQAASAGIPTEDVSFQYFVDVRYAGQSYETSIEVVDPFRPRPIVRDIADAFHAEHERRYGYRHEREPITLMAARLRSRSQARTTSLGDIGRSSVGPVAQDSVRMTYFGPGFGELAAPVIGRGRLSAVPCRGPAIVEEASTTVVVPPHWQATTDEHGNIVLEMTDG